MTERARRASLFASYFDSLQIAFTQPQATHSSDPVVLRGADMLVVKTVSGSVLLSVIRVTAPDGCQLGMVQMSE